MRRVDLEAELAKAAQAVSPIHLRHLVALGVGWPTIAEIGRHHYGLGLVQAQCGDPGLFSPGEGPVHLQLPVFEDGELVDLVAFRSGQPSQWLLRTGAGWALGLEGGLQRHTWGDDPVPLAASPLEWLQAECRGVCILDWAAPEVHYLTAIPHLSCRTGELAAMLRAALTRPVRFPMISVMEAQLVAA